MIQINYNDARPIYEKVKDSLRRLILTGALPPDSKLPSVRELAVSLSINPNTIQRAYRELEASTPTRSSAPTASSRPRAASCRYPARAASSPATAPPASSASAS